MLYQETVEPGTFQIIVDLQKKDYLHNFYLVGGTALSLQLGHRISDDIDMFTPYSFNEDELYKFLKKDFNFSLGKKYKHTLLGSIRNVKADFIAHQYKVIYPVITVNEIVMLDLADIAAMKLNAITFSGTRLKDFADIYFLLEKISLKKMLDTFLKKYDNVNPYVAAKALNYFEDINPSEKIQVLRKDFSLEKMKQRMRVALKNEEQIF